MGWSVARSEPTGDGEWRRRVSIYEGLLADPGLLDDEVWRLFTVADAAWRLSEEWANALARLAAEGDLDRGRLIDATLSAFTSDFRPNRVGWYLIMHERLRPSLDEMAARAGHYLRQLQATAKPAVTLGQRAVGRLADARRLEAGEVLRAAVPALLFPQKSVALAQLKCSTRSPRDSRAPPTRRWS